MKIYRGLSLEELNEVYQTGFFNSKGHGNAAVVEGTTCFSTTVGIAEDYALTWGLKVELEVPEWVECFIVVPGLIAVPNSYICPDGRVIEGLITWEMISRID